MHRFDRLSEEGDFACYSEEDIRRFAFDHPESFLDESGKAPGDLHTLPDKA